MTGSNMSGKSTLLRAIGLNTVLAQAGGCVCAGRMRLPPCDLQTSIRVQDSLELGLSYFMAALARLKGVVDAAERPRPGRSLLYLLDEILQGTNSAERGIAVRAVARHLLAAGAIGAMTTHDLNLAAEEPLKSCGAVLVHFTESVDEQGHMRLRLSAPRRTRDLAQCPSPDADDWHRSEGVRTVVRFAGAVALFALLTVVMTWPQAARLATHADRDQDVFFNMWRFGGSPTRCPRHPAHLSTATSFYPERRTLTLSDAMPVECRHRHSTSVERRPAGARAQSAASRRHRLVRRRNLRARRAR